MTDILIGGMQIKPVEDTVDRITGLIWGPSGAGKTTLAATAPGRKLFISFDPDGTSSLLGWPNVVVADLSSANASIVEQFKSAQNPLNLNAYIEQFDTVIIDSLTTVAE